MQDPEFKKELDKIPDADENGEPVYKIDEEDPSEKVTEEYDISSVIEDYVNEPQGNLQDLKDSTSEE